MFFFVFFCRCACVDGFLKRFFGTVQWTVFAAAAAAMFAVSLVGAHFALLLVWSQTCICICSKWYEVSGEKKNALVCLILFPNEFINYFCTIRIILIDSLTSQTISVRYHFVPMHTIMNEVLRFPVNTGLIQKKQHNSMSHYFNYFIDFELISKINLERWSSRREIYLHIALFPFRTNVTFSGTVHLHRARL